LGPFSRYEERPGVLPQLVVPLSLSLNSFQFGVYSGFAFRELFKAEI
jgi:hypothetical protein